MVTRPRSDGLLAAGHATDAGRRPRSLPVTLAKRGRAILLRSAPQGAASSGDLQAYGFAARVYISFDSTQSALPNWMEITPWVDLARTPIRITRGRTDGLSDVQSGTCALTVKNTDLRFTPKNSLGPWAGLFGKDNWLRVDVTPPSGNTSTRYVGFLNSIVPASDGLDAYTQLTASDRFGLMQSAPNYISAIGQEILTDSVYQVPSSQATLQAYYPLQEPSGSATLGDRSGNANPALTQQAVGSVPAGTGLSLANVSGPGVDAVSTVTFTPPSATTGTVLTTTVPTPAAAGTSVFALECWIKTTVGSGSAANHTFMSIADLTTTPYVIAFAVDTSGYLVFGDTSPTPNGTPLDGGHALLVNNSLGGLLNPAPILNDGVWHHLFIWVRLVGGTSAGFLICIDGKPIYGPPFSFPWQIPSTMGTLHVGGGLSGITKGLVDPFAGSMSDVAYYTLGVNFYGLPTHMPNFPQHAAAGHTGFYAESTDARIARLARYAGVPQPITPTTIVDPSTGFPVQVWSNQTATLGQWVDMQAGAHLCGTQQIAGAQPLSSVREAAHTENMPAYVSRPGNLAFRPNTSRWNLSPAWSVSASDLEAGTRFPDDKSYTFNQATITPNGQASQTVNGPAGVASQAKTGVVLNTGLSTASVNTVDAIALGTDITNRQSDPAPRPDQIVIIANTLAQQGLVPVPAAMGVNSGAGYPVYLALVPDAYQGAQVYQVTVPAGAASPKDLLDLTVPVTAGLPYSAQLRVRLPNAGANLAAHISLNWLNAGGGTISTAVGGSAAVTAGSSAYTQLTNVNATAPAGAVNVTMRLVLGTSAAAAAPWQADALQLEQSTTAGAFQQPGAGSPNLLTLDQATAGEGTPYTGGAIYGNAWYDAVLASEVSTPLAVMGWPTWRPDAATGVQLLEGYTEEIAQGTHTFTLSTSYLDPHVFTLDSADALDSSVPIGY